MRRERVWRTSSSGTLSPPRRSGSTLWTSTSDEVWTVTAYDDQDNILATKSYDRNDGGDALPVRVTFSLSDTGGTLIDSLRLHFESNFSRGMGFDNFTTTTIPAPGPLSLVGLAGRVRAATSSMTRCSQAPAVART